MGEAFSTDFQCLRSTPSSASVDYEDGQGLNRQAHVHVRHRFASYPPRRPLLPPTAAVLALLYSLHRPLLWRFCSLCCPLHMRLIQLSIVRHIDIRRSWTTMLLHIDCRSHSPTLQGTPLFLLSKEQTHG